MNFSAAQRVPKFEFRQPGTPAHRGCQPVPIAAGIQASHPP